MRIPTKKPTSGLTVHPLFKVYLSSLLTDNLGEPRAIHTFFNPNENYDDNSEDASEGAADMVDDGFEEDEQDQQQHEDILGLNGLESQGKSSA